MVGNSIAIVAVLSLGNSTDRFDLYLMCDHSNLQLVVCGNIQRGVCSAHVHTAHRDYWKEHAVCDGVGRRTHVYGSCSFHVSVLMFIQVIGFI